ncbi:unnamed protein product [Rhizophagus irregularis]|nr:unnamed protein product [Rhizophagus irregularis]
MSKSHITPGKLVATGSIIPELHYGPYLRDYKTKYAGLSYLGIDQPETAQKLLEGITFFPFIVELENITVFVSCLSKITISNSDKVGHNYAASLFHKYRRVQSVFY